MNWIFLQRIKNRENFISNASLKSSLFNMWWHYDSKDIKDSISVCLRLNIRDYVWFVSEIRIFVIRGIFDSFPKCEESTVRPRITFLGRSRLSCLLTFLSSWKIKQRLYFHTFCQHRYFDLRRDCLKFGLCKL